MAEYKGTMEYQMFIGYVAANFLTKEKIKMKRLLGGVTTLTSPVWTISIWSPPSLVLKKRGKKAKRWNKKSK